MYKRNRRQKSWEIDCDYFYDSCGVILFDYFPAKKNIAGVYYASVLDKLKTSACERTAILAEKKSVSSRQCTISHLSDFNGENPRI